MPMDNFIAPSSCSSFLRRRFKCFRDQVNDKEISSCCSLGKTKLRDFRFPLMALDSSLKVVFGPCLDGSVAVAAVSGDGVDLAVTCAVLGTEAPVVVLVAALGSSGDGDTLGIFAGGSPLALHTF